MELEIPSMEEPVATRWSFPLAISDVDHNHKCNKTVPFRPKGGEVFVFRRWEFYQYRNECIQYASFPCKFK